MLKGRSFSYYCNGVCIFVLLLIPICISSSCVSPNQRPAPLVPQKTMAVRSLRTFSSSSMNKAGTLSAQSVARWYMQGLLTHHYDDMWLVLHPDMHQKWHDETAFAGFWHTRFWDYTLHGFTLGNVQQWPDWTDPDTMQQYTHLMGCLVSLHLTLRSSPRPGIQLAPENLHPELILRNLPLVMQYEQVSPDYRGEWMVLVGGPADLEAPILTPITSVHRIVQVPILMYHHVLPYFSTDPLSDYTLPWVVNTEEFRAQMDYLAAHGYHPITLNRLFDALYYGGPLPRRPVVLTFDDGDEEHYRLVYPILLQHHFTAMFYIITGQIDWPMRMKWPQIREMLAHGMQIGSHTVNHVNLTNLLNGSEMIAQQEIQQSRQTLEQQLGIVIQQFCYPYGNPFDYGTQDQQRTIVAMLAAAGYIGATTAFGETGIVQNSTQPFALLRIPVYGAESLPDFVNSLPW